MSESWKMQKKMTPHEIWQMVQKQPSEVCEKKVRKALKEERERQEAQRAAEKPANGR